MRTITKTYNVAAGEIEFNFIFEDSIADLSDLRVLDIEQFSKGYDNDNSLEIAVYPDTLKIIVGTINESNYNSLKKLYKEYTNTYPDNAFERFYVTASLNGEQEFKGVIFKLEENLNRYELSITFIDGINRLKDISVEDPRVLNKFFELGLIPRSQYVEDTKKTYAYGFTNIEPIDDPNYTGYYVSDIQNGDKDTNLRLTIIELFKLLNPEIEVDFQNEFEFVDIIVGSIPVLIDQVNIRRILSNIFGRYIVFDKRMSMEPQIVLHPNPFYRYNYNNPGNFETVKEDAFYKVVRHTFNGTVNAGTGNPLLKFEKGVEEKTISELLKLFAKNLFSYYGFQGSGNVFFRHRRFRSEVEQTLTERHIINLNKILTVNKIKGVKIDDYYTGNYGTDGEFRTGDTRALINYKIPLNAFGTANAPFFEYRLNYFQGGQEKRVIHFKDLQTGYKDFPQEVISRAEYNSHRDFRDKYAAELIGVNYRFDRTYGIDYEDCTGKFRVIDMKRDILKNKTDMTLIELLEDEINV